MRDAILFADRILSFDIAGHAALRVWNPFEGSLAKFFLLLLAVRTPPGAIHFHAAILQTLREAVVLVRAAAVEIIGGPEHGQNYRSVQGDLSPVSRLARLFGFLFSLSSLLRHKFLYHDLQRRRQHLDALTVQRIYFAIHHQIDGPVQLKFDLPRSLPLGERMLRVRAVIKSG